MTSHNNPSQFATLAERAISRRSFLSHSVAIGASAFVMGATGSLASSISNASESRFGFKPVAANALDTVTVPENYSWQVVVSWGDPLWSKGSEFDHVSRGTGASQELAFGDNNDGMSLFEKGEDNILVVNNEYVNRSIFHGNRASGLPENADDVRKSKAGHGVSVVQVKQQNGKWSVIKDAPMNRRITGDTPMQITGPARGHALMKTSADTQGEVVLGTFNNCGNGRTPWGTYLACEENFNGNFASTDPNYVGSAEMKRYGLKNKDRGYGWYTEDARFDISAEPNEPNRHGYIVEIDPFNSESTPKKRTALGRFKHENAEVVLAANGHVVVYMGDDERGEFLYRFISRERYVEGSDNSNLLEEGDLYVARFDEDFNGHWLALTPETTGMSSQAEICIHTRLAASAVKATTMDRPEWVAANPLKSEVYCCLTNNKNRGVKTNAGGDATPIGGPNPREKNNYGQIVRWQPASGDHTAASFTWDLFVVAGNPEVHGNAYAGSANINRHNMFNSPDGLAFDDNGLLWIQTDGKYSNKGDFAGMGNNQMLVGDPSTGEIQRFMVGPKEAEVTGITWSGDRRTLFVGIQHPGEKGDSHFPGGGDSVPRSSVIAITRNDGGLIG
ncbi:MAG: PhoX family protein [Pseudomonadales bacterium]